MSMQQQQEQQADRADSLCNQLRCPQSNGSSNSSSSSSSRRERNIQQQPRSAQQFRPATKLALLRYRPVPRPIQQGGWLTAMAAVTVTKASTVAVMGVFRV